MSRSTLSSANERSSFDDGDDDDYDDDDDDDGDDDDDEEKTKFVLADPCCALKYYPAIEACDKVTFQISNCHKIQIVTR